MVKLCGEVSSLVKPRKQSLAAKWTDVEVAQVLVAVYNMGEGDWVEIQRRIDFTSSSEIKSANQVAEKYKQVKRVMRRDFQRLRRKLKGSKVMNRNDWILLALRELNDNNPTEIGLKD